MATALEIAELRKKVSELDSSTYTDEYLTALIDEKVSLNLCASLIWEEKAADYAELVDISEAGSSRKNSQLYTNALSMAKHFGGLYASEGDVADIASASTTRKIVRA